MEHEIKSFLEEVEQYLDYKLDDKVLHEDVPESIKQDEPSSLKKIKSPRDYYRKFKEGKEGYKKLLLQSEIIGIESNLPDTIAKAEPIGNPLESTLTQISHWDRNASYKSTVYSSYKEALHETEQLYKRIESGANLDYQQIKRLVEFFFQTLLTDKAFLLNLSSWRQASAREDYLYSHALNVCLMSLNIATSFGYSESQVMDVGVSGLLADVGMMFIPKNIRFKTGKLSEHELYEVRKHPIIGCRVLEHIRGIPEHLIVSVYQHHERESGNGYPRKRKGNLIHSYAQIISVSDVYEALSSQRSYRTASMPYKAMETILRMTNKGHLNNNKVRDFIRYMSLFPIGSLVQLESGEIGKVVDSNGSHFTRPVVSILTDKEGRMLNDDEVNNLDLSRYTDSRIKQALENNHIRNHVLTGF
ncbi:MAG: HD domain-containing protein [Fibrobacteria bacterium]|nr:HD domain-containing protein [Fibrobacteria bacterium]